MARRAIPSVYTGATVRIMQEVGVRELRNHVAAVIRRAAAGERIVVTVDGRPAAQLGPLEPDHDGVTLADLVAAGLVDSPARADRSLTEPVVVPVDVRPDALLTELRGP